MTLLKLLQLSAINLRRDVKSALFSVFGTAVGIGALVFFVALGEGVQGIVRDKLFPIDTRAIEVVPPAVSFGKVIGGGRLDEPAFQSLAQIDGVERAYRKMALRVPAMAGPSATLVQSFRVPRNVHVALVAIGVEADFVSGDVLSEARFADPQGEAPIPALAARRLLELYNHSFAKSQGLPSISERLLGTVTGIDLIQVRLGRTLNGETGMPQTRANLAFAGLSDRAPLHGVLIPLETARRLNAAYGQDAETYSSVTLLARDPGRLAALQNEVKARGFSIDTSERELADKVGLAVSITTGALALLSALICLLAAVNIAHALLSSVRVREREFGLLRALGATRREVALLVFTEAGLIGLMGGLLGALAARLLALGLGGFIAARIPDFPFGADAFFLFSPALLMAAVALAVIAALAGAIAPTAVAAGTSPARVLAG